MLQAADAGKEMAIVLLDPLGHPSPFFPLQKTWLLLLIFSAGWVVWKTARSALLGWARIERLHRVIEEERWEIEHHRAARKRRADRNVHGQRAYAENFSKK